MTWAENLFQNLLTVGILGLLALIVYLKYTKITFGDLLKGIIGFFREKPAEVLDELQMQGGFENIK